MLCNSISVLFCHVLHQTFIFNLYFWGVFLHNKNRSLLMWTVLLFSIQVIKVFNNFQCCSTLYKTILLVWIILYFYCKNWRYIFGTFLASNLKLSKSLFGSICTVYSLAELLARKSLKSTHPITQSGWLPC